MKCRTYSIKLLTSRVKSSALACERIALACDSRIPRESIGYVDDLISGMCAREVEIDRIERLSSHVTFVN